MKRAFAVAAALAASAALLLSGCGQPIRAETAGGRLSVVCTVFPHYDWTRQLLGKRIDELDLTLLVGNGTDLHSFQPSVADIVKISSCDLFIHVGGESDAWVADALSEAANPDMRILNLMEALGEGLKPEAVVEGVAAEEESREGEEAYDEHIWLSFKNAEVLSSAIAGELSALDPKNGNEYADNLSSYIEKLRAADSLYREAVSASSSKTLLFGDRFPFRYLTDDYGLSYYAAFPGCSAETEASFETVAFLADKLDELGLSGVVVTDSADLSVAQTIIANTKAKDQDIFVLDAIQSVTPQEIEEGVTWLSIMENNLAALKEALA
ncbi:MAG: metal ABC transporter substrate-binding protein [Oscillospiraceae bacterium]|jgi:zinc transport system substrate-binding protein|nr:metal ABC transporter substrate-binding protein [Oscillospiraceae bacterium]